MPLTQTLIHTALRHHGHFPSLSSVLAQLVAREVKNRPSHVRGDFLYFPERIRAYPLRPFFNPGGFRRSVIEQDEFPTVTARIIGFSERDRRTFLHLAVRLRDVPLAYESLRLGINIDAKDYYGMTPLFFACMWLRLLHQGRVRIPSGGSPESNIERIFRVARLLIEQHADVNLNVDGETPLTIAASIPNIPLVMLLLEHGARLPESFLSSGKFPLRAHRASLMRIIKSRDVLFRPPRPCPCWSGAMLAECHAHKEQPYPAEFLCPCEKPKSYRKCCIGRDFEYIEKWDEKHQRIATGKVEVHRISSIPLETANIIASFVNDAKEHDMDIDMDIVRRLRSGFTMIQKDNPDIDPAFAFAMGVIKDFPLSLEPSLC
ncbi:unnamed protein product [Somion occarium]|uniref:Ankyrin repeat protein n=1 Tax=Somion occarium TaxID=3059160 RepID=A0ABP1EAV0_9APHY